MPGGDGTGPRGLGPMTGRGMGYCVGYVRPRFMNPRFGPGFGRGRRFGRGFGRGRGQRFFINSDYDPYYEEPITQEEEKEILGVEARGLEAELKRIKGRIKTLESIESK